MEIDTTPQSSSKDYLFSAKTCGFNADSLPEFTTGASSPSIARYWRTLKYLRISQIFYLLVHRVIPQKSLLRQPDADVSIRPSDGLPQVQEWQPALARKIIETGHVEFVRELPQAFENIPWSAQETSRRQIYHANYCDFLNVDLSSIRDTELLHRAIEIAVDWCEQNSTGKEMGWHPFFVSLRVVNWLKFLVRNAARAKELGDGKEIELLLKSVRIQVLSLESRLERELLANHLLKNAKALVFAGALLEAPESIRWSTLGQRLLVEQLAEQILPDGGHIERSPMYHAWVLDHLQDLQNLFVSCPPVLPGCATQVSRCIERMSFYLSQIIHPDGEIPLLNDSQLGVTRPSSEILGDAGLSARTDDIGVSVQVFAESGYAVIRDCDSDSFLIFDCGRVGPDYQPGHGHADVLSFELTLHGKRVIVDTGVSSYEPSAERHYERSTAAHNTVRIDNVDQAEIWGSFRIGRRPSVSAIGTRSIAGSQFVQGAHFGYKQLGLVHSRAIVHLQSNAWVFVDRITGGGRHKVDSFFHFHPDIELTQISESGACSPDVMMPRWSFRVNQARYIVMTMPSSEPHLTSAWYSPGFAIRQRQSVIHGVWNGTTPITLVYAIVPVGVAPILINRQFDPHGIEVNGHFIPL